jgi:hypothetical protein
MSKGKHQASQNAKKLLVAEDRVATLEHELAKAVSASRAKEQELLTEIQALRNRLVSDVDSLAALQVEEAQRKAQKLVDDAQAAHEKSVIEAFRYLSESGEVRASLEGWGEVAKILRVHPGTLIASASNETTSRVTRRANRSYINAIAKQSEWKGA